MIYTDIQVLKCWQKSLAKVQCNIYESKTIKNSKSRKEKKNSNNRGNSKNSITFLDHLVSQIVNFQKFC
jgi:transposase